MTNRVKLAPHTFNRIEVMLSSDYFYERVEIVIRDVSNNSLLSYLSNKYLSCTYFYIYVNIYIFL